MTQRRVGVVAHEWFSSDAWSRHRSKAVEPPRSRTHGADFVLHIVCASVARLAIDPIPDPELLFEQYDFKLWSQGDHLFVFCLSVLPGLLGMAAVFILFQALSKLRST